MTGATGGLGLEHTPWVLDSSLDLFTSSFSLVEQLASIGPLPGQQPHDYSSLNGERVCHVGHSSLPWVGQKIHILLHVCIMSKQAVAHGEGQGCTVKVCLESHWQCFSMCLV